MSKYLSSMPKSDTVGPCGRSISSCLRSEPKPCFPKWLPKFELPPLVNQISSAPTHMEAFVVICFVGLSYSDLVSENLKVVLIYTSTMAKGI